MEKNSKLDYNMSLSNNASLRFNNSYLSDTRDLSNELIIKRIFHLLPI